MNSNAIKPGNIDDYISAFPKETQIILEEIRSVIRKAAPDALGMISSRLNFRLYPSEPDIYSLAILSLQEI